MLFTSFLKMASVTIMNVKDAGAKNAGTVKSAEIFLGGFLRSGRVFGRTSCHS
jgi:hypothetical protein